MPHKGEGRDHCQGEQYDKGAHIEGAPIGSGRGVAHRCRGFRRRGKRNLNGERAVLWWDG